MNRATLLCLASLLLALTVLPRAAASANADALPVAGWLERVRLFPGDVLVDAKLDSGSRNSSLHALNIERFERGAKAEAAQLYKDAVYIFGLPKPYSAR